MFIAMAVFFFALVGVVALFSVKYIELRKGIMLCPALRARADGHAVHIKELVLAARADLSKVPPELVRFGHLLVHEAALALASFARVLERRAHQLADFVSHKRHYERRETRSEFLKKVAERTNGGLDTTSNNGHNT